MRLKNRKLFHVKHSSFKEGCFLKMFHVKQQNIRQCLLIFGNKLL